MGTWGDAGGSGQWRGLWWTSQPCCYCRHGYPGQAAMEEGVLLLLLLLLIIIHILLLLSFITILFYKVPHYLAAQYTAGFLASAVVFLVYWDALVW